VIQNGMNCQGVVICVYVEMPVHIALGACLTQAQNNKDNKKPLLKPYFFFFILKIIKQ